MVSFRRFPSVLSVALLLAILPIPQDVFAQDHVVSPADLQKAAAAASQAREQNLAKVRNFFSSDEAQKALKSAEISYQKVDKAVSTLNDEELARIAARTDKAQKDFAAGRISDRDLLIILVAVAALILIIVAVR